MSRLELQHELHDVAATTLYRHLNKLVDTGFVQIVGERVSGANRERLYEALPLDLSADDTAQLTGDDYLRIVTAVATELVGNVQRVIGGPLGLHGRSTFGVQVFFATDAEHLRILKRFDAFLADLDNEFPPGPDRVQRALSYGMCPRNA